MPGSYNDLAAKSRVEQTEGAAVQPRPRRV